MWLAHGTDSKQRCFVPRCETFSDTVFVPHSLAHSLTIVCFCATVSPVTKITVDVNGATDSILVFAIKHAAPVSTIELLLRHATTEGVNQQCTGGSGDSDDKDDKDKKASSGGGGTYALKAALDAGMHGIADTCIERFAADVGVKNGFNPVRILFVQLDTYVSLLAHHYIH
jgi:hypothetical protein